jgi:diguanylate cyclase (GGDEF)-like protein/PAS domain S-box-containing protein
MTNHNLLQDPAVGAVVCELVDVSEEMAAQEAVRTSEQLLRRLTDALPVGVVQLDPARRVVYVNDRTTSVLGRPLVGRSAAGYADLVSVVDEADRPRLEQLVAAALDDGVDGDVELGIAWVGGAARRMEVTVRPLSHDGRVSGVLLCLADVTDAAALREQLFRMATVDTLTGCLTRAALLPRLEELLAAAAPGTGRAVGVLFFDLDGFKRINDDHGHTIGDHLLAAIGSRLLEQVRPGALVGRLGGDEFLVVDTSSATPEQAEAEAVRLRDAVQLVALMEGRVVSRVSVGWAWTDRPVDAATLVAAADADMYTHKTGRRR